jgi:hypothetical protein
MKIAICYYGLLRTFKKASNTHMSLFQLLKNKNIEFDVFIHTWTGSLVNKRGNTNLHYENNLNDMQLVNPRQCIIDNQDTFLQNLNFQDYFYKHIFETYGEGRHLEWFPDLVLFHLCAIESQRRVVEMVHKSNIIYDKIVMLRPDIQFLEEFPVKFLYDMTPKRVYLPSHDLGEGYNDMVGIFNASEIDPYVNRMSKAKEYRATVGRIVAEKYSKHSLDENNYSVNLISMPFRILREYD